MRLLLAPLLPGVAGSAACATQSREALVYHCGPDARDLRDFPCAELGHLASSVRFDTPDSADRDAARAAAQANARRAAQMQHDRQAADTDADTADALRRVAAAAPLAPPANGASAPVQVVGHKYPPRPRRPRPPHPSAL